MRQLKIYANITNRESAALEKYLQEISKVELLSLEEEVELAKRIREGDDKALEKLVKSNLRFVVSVAKHYQHNGITLTDLINEGNLGLMKAARRYDETKGFKFISYAVWWIRQAIMQALVEHSRIIRLPGNKIESYQKINKMLLQFLQDFQREPTLEELSEMSGLTEKEVSEIMQINTRHVSIDIPLDEESSDSSTLSETIADADTPEPDTELWLQSLKGEVLNALSYLTPREANIIKLSFGLGDKSPMASEDIAEELGISKERVRQIREKAIRRLRKTSRSKLLKSYLG